MDSFRLKAAGAAAVDVAEEEPWDETLRKLLAREQLDWVVVEGYHGAPLLQFLVLNRGEEFPEERQRARGWILGAVLRERGDPRLFPPSLPIYSEREAEALAKAIEAMAAPKPAPFPVAGCILAGGRSRRMGRDKRLLQQAGTTWLAIAAHALAGAVEGPLFAAGTPPEEDPHPELTWLPDLRPGEGPLAALYGLALRVTSPWLLVVPTDMPFLTKEALYPFLEILPQAEREGVDAFLPKLKDGWQPMPGLYRRVALLRALSLLAGGERSLHSWRIRQKVWALPEETWRKRGIDPEKVFMDVDDEVTRHRCLP